MDEIKAIEEKFAGAALRARLAGFDAVELHGAHGYLIAQFLSPFSNRRADEYGGTLENRARFAVETVKAVKEKAGRDYPVIFRISATEFMDQGMNVEQAKACLLYTSICFGGVLSVFPNIVSENFGLKNMGINYGIVFTAYGIAAIIGPMTASAVKHASGSYQAAFIIAGVFAAAAFVLVYIIYYLAKKNTVK